ncbi:MAG: ABC transporter, partial [Clostridiales bacterium]|nr:ABC transporter [Clostridiales bacterium]
MGGPGQRHSLNMPVEKPKDFQATMKKLLTYCKKYLAAILIALIAAAGGTILQIAGPDRLKTLTNEIMKGLPSLVNGKPVLGAIDMSAILTIALALSALYAFSFLLNLLQSQIMATVTQRISKRMRSDISQKVNRLPLKYFDSTSYGNVLSHVTNDVDAIGQTLSQSLGALITAVTMLLGSLVMMLYNSWILAMTAIGASLIGFVLMMLIMKHSQKYFSEQQKELGKINGHIEEVYTGHNIVKVYNGSREANRVFEESNTTLYQSAWKSQFLSGLMMPVMGFVGNLGYVAVCVVGAALAVNGTITFGVIVAFMMYVRLFTQPLSQIAQSMNNLQRTAAASERV